MTQYLGGRKFSKKKVGLKQSRAFRKVLLGVVPVFGLAFLTAFLASSVFAPISTSNAAETTVTANVSYGAYSLTLTTAASVTLNVNADRNGVMTVGTSNVSTSTTSPSGYKLYLGMTGDNAYTNALVNTTDANKKITSTGTFADPVALTNGTWGYAIPKNTATVLSNGFDTSYSTITSGTPTAEKYAAIPYGDSAPQKIAQTGTSNTTPNVIPVYYGVRAGYDTPTGSYTNTVLYTAVADAGSSSDLYVSPDETPAINGGEPLTLTTTLVSTASTINAKAYLLTQAQYASVTAASNPVDVRTLTSAELSNCQRVADVDMLQLTCTAPAKDPGTYYIYVNVPDYGLYYAKQFNYVKNFYNISTMQEMTTDICNDTKYVVTPKSTIFNGTNIYGQTGTATSANADEGNSLFRPNHPGNPNYVPQVELEDTRPSVLGGTSKTVTYTVRKLADGNCWMTENLALNWNSTSYPFTSDTSNVQSTKTANEKTQALTATGGDASTDEQNAWKEPSGDGSSPNRWLSRSTNEATENSYSAAAVQTGEDQPLGTYYNWYTATVGSVTGEGEATEDICPKGWKLPNYSGNGSWMYLIRDTYHLIASQGAQPSQTANDTMHKFPLSLPYSGYVNRVSGATVDRGTYGNFWSAGTTSTVAARGLHFNGSYVYPEGNYYKTAGFSVRCIAKQVSE